MTASTRNLIAVAVLVAAPWACDREKKREFELGASEVIAVAGLRHVVGRSVSVGGERILVAGESGNDLRARIIWADRRGEVLTDASLPSIVRPHQAATCVEGERGQVLFVEEREAGVRVSQVDLEGAGFGSTPPTPTVVYEGPGPVQVAPIENGATACGLCLYLVASGTLSCRGSLVAAEPTTWETGPLQNWSVHQAREQLVLVDWYEDEERWVTTRTALLPVDSPEAFTWLHGWVVGQRPEPSVEFGDSKSRPRITVTGSDIWVAFVDHSRYLQRVFIQAFPLSGADPGEAVQVGECRGDCDLKWLARFDEATWVWFDTNLTDVLVRVADATGEQLQAHFEAPRDTIEVEGDFFKLGLGNQLGNIWSLVAGEEG